MKTTHVTRTEAHDLAERCAELLRRQFGARRVVIFGSAAGDAPWHSRSDLDLAVEGLRSKDYWPALNACQALLPPGLALDLIPMEDAWPELAARLEGGIEMPGDPVEALRFEIGTELQNLERVVARLSNFLQQTAGQPDEMQVAGAAKHLHDFYNGVERIFERIAIRIDGDLPAGPNWHALLLRRMGQPFGARRPAVITRALEEELSEHLRFRHLFRHTYGYDLKWGRVRELGETLPDILAALQSQTEAFLAGLATSRAE